MLRSARDPDVGKETNIGQAKKNKKKEALNVAVVFVVHTCMQLEL
jgi:hypothetical protein